MITLKNVSYSINKKNILSNISFHLIKGEKVLITGPSGCGKSTIFNLILKNISPSQGSIYYDKEDIAHYSSSKLNEYRKNKVVAITQQDDLFPSLTVLENLSLFFYEQDIIKMLKLSQLYSLKDCLVSSLSGGERQRIAILKACLESCEVLLCDEITSALDKENATKIIQFILQMFPRQTILFISHDPDLFEGKIHHYIYIDNHKIVQDKVLSEVDNKKIRFKVKKKKSFYFNALHFGIKKLSFPLFVIYILTVICFNISLSFQDIFQYFAQKSYQEYFDYDVVAVKDDSSLSCDYKTIFPNIDDWFMKSEVFINNKKLNNLRFSPFYNQKNMTKIVVNSLLLENQNIDKITSFQLKGEFVSFKSANIQIVEEDNMFSFPCIYYDLVYFAQKNQNIDYQSVYLIQYDFTKKDTRFTNNPLFEVKKENKPYVDNNAYKDYLTYEMVFTSIQDIVNYFFLIILFFSFAITILIQFSRLLKDKKNIAILLSRGYSDLEILLIYFTSTIINSLIILPICFLIKKMWLSFLLSILLQILTSVLCYGYLKKKKLHNLLKEEILT